MDRVVVVGPVWDRVWTRRRPILVFTLTATLVVGIIAFLLPPWYRAEAELLPPGEEDTGSSLISLMRGGGVPGFKIPTQVTPGDVFLEILHSRYINGQVVERFDLKKRYKKKFMVDALKELAKHTDFKLTLAGTIQIVVEDKSRAQAAEMANAYVQLLDRFNRESRMTKGRRSRLFIEGRLGETKAELASAEQRLVQYQAEHKTVALTPGMSSALEESARLYARRMALQVRLGVVRSYSQGSEEELQILQELAQLDRQMSSLPATGLELARLVRDVKIHEQVFELLTAQYEEARITEARDVVTVDVLDSATPPEKKVRPRRGTMMAAAFALSLALGVGLAIVRKEQPHLPAMRAVARD